MTPSRATAQEIRKARSWADACHGMIEAAEYQLKLALSAGDGPRIAQARIALQGVKNQRASALEDWQGWQDFRRRFVG